MENNKQANIPNSFQNNSGGKKAQDPVSGESSQSETEPANKEAPKDKKEEGQQSGGLFGSMPQPKTDFFGRTGEQKSSGGLFSGLVSGDGNKNTGLFGSLTGNSAAGGLFSGLVDSSKTNKTGAGTNIFSGNISSTFLKPQENVDGEGEGNEESEEENDQNEKEEVIDKNASTGNYKYEEHTENLVIKEVSNFKVNDIPGYGKGNVSLEKMKDNGNVMVIFRNPAKLIKYQG